MKHVFVHLKHLHFWRRRFFKDLALKTPTHETSVKKIRFQGVAVSEKILKEI
jgi:hypothetical protein